VAGTLPGPDKDAKGVDDGERTVGDDSGRAAAEVCERDELEHVDEIDVLVDVGAIGVDIDVLVDVDAIGVFVGVDDDVRTVCLRTSE